MHAQMVTSVGGRTASRRSLSLTSLSSHPKKKTTVSNAGGLPVSPHRKSLFSSRSMGLTGERTVKRLRLSKALMVPDSTSIYDACRKMAAHRVDALLLTDSNALLCGILMDKDITTRVIASEVNIQETPVSKFMTKHPIFVLSDTLAVEALQKMVLGKFRHLPVVENGEVIALLDIAKCLYDAIAHLERAAEKGKAIVAAVEGVEKNWGASASGSDSFIETLRERMFRPSLSTIISENPKTVTVEPNDTILDTAKKMFESQTSSAIVAVDKKPQGILTSKDILMRVIAQDLSPESILVERVMTPNPEYGIVVAVVDVLHITHAAVATVGNTSGVNNEVANTRMQKFWDSAMELSPDDEEETRSISSLKLASEGAELRRCISYPSSSLPNTFAFKIQDRTGRMHRFNCNIGSMRDLITAIIQRVGDDIKRKNLPQILYEDEDHDKVVLATESDLTAAVGPCKMCRNDELQQGLRLHLDYSGKNGRRKGSSSNSLDTQSAWASAYSAVVAGAALVAGLGVIAFLRRSTN
ncbi:hypothetical protein H5410_061319 [Solanum commersonii]|uniref:CBS domain containing protein n=1 Tax=Solanum commersonii TaxID=4109 RepID=A0A9J5W7S1_SOLCO|nr:hypothetical protein H5410_061319 [Solanum commersonii]